MHQWHKTINRLHFTPKTVERQTKHLHNHIMLDNCSAGKNKQSASQNGNYYSHLVTFSALGVGTKMRILTGIFATSDRRAPLLK